MTKLFKNRLILISLLLASLILLASVGIIFTISYSKLNSESLNHLRLAIMYIDDEQVDNYLVHSYGDYAIYNNIYNGADLDNVIVIEEPKDDSNVLYVHSSRMIVQKDLEQLVEIYNKIKLSAYSHSQFDDYGMHLTETTQSCRYTAIMVNGGINTGTNQLILYGGLASLVGVICFFVLSMIAARVAFTPIEKSWTQQRQFVADASHELKTPLSVIMANTEIIASNASSTVESQMKWIENTRSESKRMSKLITNLLMLAKNDSGLKVSLEPTNLSDIARTIALTHDSLLYENNKQFKSIVDGEAIVNGNAQQLEQLVTVLLDNANKYSLGKGNIDMRLSVIGKQVTLMVSNDSNPLSDEQLKHIFDRFYIVDNARNKNDSGNGLGLAIAKLITTTHKGKIVASHEHGRTTFTVTIPLIRQPKAIDKTN